jgi:hypothetical protein
MSLKTKLSFKAQAMRTWQTLGHPTRHVG